MTIFTEFNHLVKALDPVADAWAGTVSTDVINMKDFSHCTFISFMGVGTTGSSTITVEACDDVVPNNVSAIPYHSREILTGDTPGALTLRAAAGFINTIGSSKIVVVEVDSDALAASGFGYVRQTMVESANDPVLGGILAILSGARYARNVMATAIV